MALKWFTFNCAEAKYLVKMDDDVFINTPNVYKYLVNQAESTDFIMGRYIPPCPPYRKGPYEVTHAEYPPHYFPSFADRFAIIYSNDVVRRLYKKAQKTKFLWVDDAFVTGVVRLQMNVAITDLQSFTFTQEDIDHLKETSLHIPRDDFLFSIENISSRDQRLLWEKTEWSRMQENE